ncbi:MAG TPA: hypothetical protein VGV39_11920 [Mesorhizobium sp.]|jgi:hypothetical protein|uniref:hypothetical protein n=1 Tax=Mesorhizobium sp. TaxID=1871066 RepID=UPI002DDD3413|nr:hypothetical protein [Mesorhizobium sp.]HEV2503775.1 hypothetical protein [Mesorhizobium sp.]
MAKETQIRKPQYHTNQATYEADCRDALTGQVDRLLDEAEAAGWERTKAASALMYLSAKRLSPGSST